jgi:membrane-associated protein
VIESVKYFVDLFVHLDTHLAALIADYGQLTYLILFVIIFCETGLVVTPILPGDSLLFAAGALSANTELNPVILIVLLSIAAVAGDFVNYKLGQKFGENARFINRKHIEKTHEFYERYGAKTIVIARFVPIVRTFAPFVAGVGNMSYSKFVPYNIFGGLLWVNVGILAGYFFGSLPFVEKNFTLVLIVIVIISVMPAVFEVVRARRANRSSDAVPK